jgi:hypothetical protein
MGEILLLQALDDKPQGQKHTCAMYSMRVMTKNSRELDATPVR